MAHQFAPTFKEVVPLSRFMVDRQAARIAAIVGGAALLFVAAGQILRLFTRFMTFALLVAAVAVLTYIAYSIAKGWSEASAEEEMASQPQSEADRAREEYVDGQLSEEELEAELETLIEEER